MQEPLDKSPKKRLLIYGLTGLLSLVGIDYAGRIYDMPAPEVRIMELDGIGKADLVVEEYIHIFLPIKNRNFYIAQEDGSFKHTDQILYSETEKLRNEQKNQMDSLVKKHKKQIEEFNKKLNAFGK